MTLFDTRPCQNYIAQLKSEPEKMGFLWYESEKKKNGKLKVHPITFIVQPVQLESRCAWDNLSDLLVNINSSFLLAVKDYQISPCSFLSNRTESQLHRVVNSFYLKFSLLCDGWGRRFRDEHERCKKAQQNTGRCHTHVYSYSCLDPIRETPVVLCRDWKNPFLVGSFTVVLTSSLWADQLSLMTQLKVDTPLFLENSFSRLVSFVARSWNYKHKASMKIFAKVWKKKLRNNVQLPHFLNTMEA